MALSSIHLPIPQGITVQITHNRVTVSNTTAPWQKITHDVVRSVSEADMLKKGEKVAVWIDEGKVCVSAVDYETALEMIRKLTFAIENVSA